MKSKEKRAGGGEQESLVEIKLKRVVAKQNMKKSFKSNSIFEVNKKEQSLQQNTESNRKA